MTPMETSVRKILIVEDDPHLSRAMAIRIRAAGYQVVVACDAVQATSFWRKENPSAIIMDIRMPAGDGLRIHESLNEHPDFLIPVIYVSGDGNPEDQARARELGAAAFLHKPVDFNRLLTCIRGCIDAYPSMALEKSL